MVAGWWLVAAGGWRLVADGGWQLVVGGWWRLAYALVARALPVDRTFLVCSTLLEEIQCGRRWRQPRQFLPTSGGLAVDGWRLAVGGGLSLGVVLNQR